MAGDEEPLGNGKEPPHRWLARGSAIDRLLARVETMFELGTSALVPIATIGLPIVLAIVSFFVVPYEMSQRLRGDTDVADEEYASLSPYVGFEGDAPPDEQPATGPDVPLPAEGDPAAPTDGVAQPSPADAVAGPDTPDNPGSEPATAPAVGRGVTTGSPAGVSAEAGKTKAGGRTKKCEPVPNPKIAALGEKRWRIDRKIVDYYATHIKALDELGWVSKWKAEDGSQKGFKVGGLACGNDAWQAGLRNGDVVLTVNGTKVGSILEGIAAYAKHRKADVIALEILRRDELRSHTYRME